MIQPLLLTERNQTELKEPTSTTSNPTEPNRTEMINNVYS